MKSRSQFTLRSILAPHAKALTLAFAAVLAEGAMDILEPWPLKIVFDSVIGSKRMTGLPGRLAESFSHTDKSAALGFAVALVMGIAIVAAISSYTEKFLTTKVGQLVMHDLRMTLYHHIQRLSLGFYSKKPTGDLISRVTTDISAVQDFVSSALLGIVVDLLTLAGMLGVMFYLDWKFTLIALAVSPLLFLSVYGFTRRIKKASREVRKKESEILSVIQEVITSIKVVKAFASEDYEERRLERESLKSVDVALKARGMKALLLPIVDLLVAASTCLILWYGARLVISGEITAGSLLVFLLYLGNMYKPMKDLSKMTDTVSRAAVGIERIREVLDTDVVVHNLPGARRAFPFRGAVEFNHVSFSYEPGLMTLKGVEFKVEPGQLIALVGPTGAGKSSIVSLIPRFYDPASGEVRIDGFDIRRFNIQSLRQQISFVLQETMLFRAPLWQNIVYGTPNADKATTIRAARLAHADEFIEKLPDGYDTMVGERGVTLSGGQRQRIAIARAIIRNSPILILDEPTTGLDSASEEAVFEALIELMKGRTTFVVSHNLSLIQNADQILVVDDGRIVDRGRHEELLTNHGLYRELYDVSFTKMHGAVLATN